MKKIFLPTLCLLPFLASAQVGDGKADDTAAIQSLIDAAGQGGTVHLAKPSKYYRITRSLRIGDLHGLTISGDSEVTTRIVADLDNAPVIAFTLESHSITIEGLTLEYRRPQNAQDDPRSSAIAEVNEDGKNRPAGLYRHTYRNLEIINATRGFSVLREAPGDKKSVNPWWGSRWDKIWFLNVSRTLIELNLGPTGAPCNEFDSLLTMKGGNDGHAAAFELRGEAIMHGIDVEDWSGQILSAPSAGYILLEGLHVERHRPGPPNDKGRLFEVANGKFDLRGAVVNFVSGSAGPRTVVYFGPNATGTVDGLTVLAPPAIAVTETTRVSPPPASH
jgi:hypothetical protein